jgi:hypothetical protein
MSTSSPLRRSIYGLGAATVLTLTLTGPASARPIPGDMPMTAGAVTAQVPAEHAAQPHSAGAPSYNTTWSGWSPPSAAGGQVSAAGGATDTLQYFQIGLGVLSGALLSAGALTVVARSHRGRLTHA